MERSVKSHVLYEDAYQADRQYSQASNDIRSKKNDTQKQNTTEMSMLRWARGKTKKDHIKNDDIWREANIGPMTTFLRSRRLRWYGHVLRKEGEDATKKMLHMLVQGKRRRDGCTRRYIKDDMKLYNMVQHRSVWHMDTTDGTFLHGEGT